MALESATHDTGRQSLIARLREAAGRLSAVEDRRVLFLLVIALGLSALLGGGLIMRMIGETGGSNSYALLADAFLHGRLHVSGCVDVDCARFNGRNYVVFPPGPVLIIAPLVALFGKSFSGFIALAVMAAGFGLAAWWRILDHLRVERATALWLMLALGLATPLYYVAIRGDGVWFLSQSFAFMFMSLAFLLALKRERLALAGVLIGLAFLCRQMSLFLAPFIFALSLEPQDRLFKIDRARITALAKMALPVIAAIGLYMVYNFARFGSPLDTGYSYILAPAADQTFLTRRGLEIGLFSPVYVLFNLFHLLFQGFHVEFGGRHLIDLIRLDANGTSILAASPFILLALFAPMRRTVVIGLICTGFIVGVMLFYHSNGFTQYNAQRYVLDWLPVAVYMLALGVTPALRPALALLVTYALGLNVVAMAVLATTAL
jgi:hypothetical protein